jgi:hypothetical protein
MYDPQQHPPSLPQAQENEVAGYFPLPFELQIMYRISINIFRSFFLDGFGYLFNF